MTDETLPRILDEERSLDSNAVRRLAFFMSELSEKCWYAGWMQGTETDLWHHVSHGPGEWGMGETVDASECAQLRELHEACGGWVVWDDGVGERFVTTSEWCERLSAGKAPRGHRG